MDEKGFREYLQKEGYASSTVNYACGWALEAENYLKEPLDNIVNDDKKMYEALLKLKAFDETIGSTTQNAIRRYHEYLTGEIFPKIRDYERIVGIRS